MRDSTTLNAHQRLPHTGTTPVHGTTRAALRVAATGCSLVVLVFLVDGFTRPGFDPWRQQISHLSLGDRGWLGTVNLLLAGVCVLAAAEGYHRLGLLRRRVNPLAIAGAGLVAAAAFPIDPGQGYPPGADPTHSWHGTIHDISGAVFFIALTVALFVLGRRMRNVDGWHIWGRVATACAVGVICCWLVGSVLTGLDFSGAWPSAPAGAFERLAMGVGMVWLSATSLRLLRPLAVRSG